MSFFKATPFPLKFLMISFQADPQHKTPAPSGFVLSVGGTIIIHSNDPEPHFESFESFHWSVYGALNKEAHLNIKI